MHGGKRTCAVKKREAHRRWKQANRKRHLDAKRRSNERRREWRELFRTRDYDGAYRTLRRETGTGYTKDDFLPVDVKYRGRNACSAYESKDGRYRVVADVDPRGRSVRIVQERRAST